MVNFTVTPLYETAYITFYSMHGTASLIFNSIGANLSIKALERNVPVFYVILHKTPAGMRRYKPYILFHMVRFFLDVFDVPSRP